MANGVLQNTGPWVSQETWVKLKAGAALAGLVVGTIAVCAVATFACAYAQSSGNARGLRDAATTKKPGDTNSSSSPSSVWGSSSPFRRDNYEPSDVPISSGPFGRSSFDRAA